MILFAILACPQEISEETTDSLLRQCNIGEQKLIRDKQSLTRQAGALQQVCAMWQYYDAVQTQWPSAAAAPV